MIKTIDELLRAQKHDPQLVKECFAQVTVMEDLENYLKWLHDSQAEIAVTSGLSRRQSRSLGIHPSSAAKKGACLLKLYFECTGEIEPRRIYDPDTQRTWDIGTMLHDLYQCHFWNMYGDQFHDEVSLESPDLRIKSHTDGIFDFSRIRFALEMKSIKEGGNFGFAKVQTAPMEDNVRQAYFYMKIGDIPFALIFYICKNNGGLKEHAVMFDPKVWHSIENETVQPVIQALKTNQRPLATAGWHCRQCQFCHKCPGAKQEQSNAKILTRNWGTG